MTDRWLTNSQQRSWRSFLLGVTLLMERIDRDLREKHGLSQAEYELLVRLSEAPEHELRMAELADSVKNSRSRITHTITRLEDPATSYVGPASRMGGESRRCSRRRVSRSWLRPRRTTSTRSGTSLIDVVDDR